MNAFYEELIAFLKSKRHKLALLSRCYFFLNPQRILVFVFLQIMFKAEELT